MLVLMSGSGNGLEEGIISGVKDFPKNSCYFFSERTSKAYAGFAKGRNWSIHTSDVEVLRGRFPEIERISAIMFEWNEKNTLRNNKYGAYMVKGLRNRGTGVSRDVYAGRESVRKVVTDKWSGLSGSRCEYSGNENTDRRPFRSIYYFTV